MKLPVSPTALRTGLPLAALALVFLMGAAFGVEIGLLVLAGCALVAVIALLWGSVQSLTGESPLTLEEALTLGAPSAEEEQKRAVLRALKDLEFERGVGKITEEDYAELSARYRDEAKRLIQLLDEGSQPNRERVEKLLAERLAKGKKGPAAEAPSAPAPTEEAEAPSAEAVEARSAPAAAPSAVEPGDTLPAERSRPSDVEGTP